MSASTGAADTAAELTVTGTDEPAQGIEMPSQPTGLEVREPLLHVCTDRGDVRPSPEAEAGALEERADNLMVTLLDRPGIARMAIETRQMWAPGRRLRVRFLDGESSVQARVMAVAQQWSVHASIDFVASRDPDAEIRISFAQRGQSWSWVGTGALDVAPGEPTMNYGWLEASTGDSEYQRVVLHEFGHALGCVHEHQSPTAGSIPWDVQAVYAYYARTNRWDKAMVDRNVLGRYSATWVNASAFDRSSIMLYPVPEELTIGTWSTPWNGALSAQDKAFIATKYPRAGAPDPVELAVDGPAHEADLASAGETDVYAFDVTRRKRHILHTEGPTDTVMSLHGPDDPVVLVGADSDRGRGTNARIVRTLSPGRYVVRVRHETTTGSGAYAIRVRTRAL